MTSLRDFQKCKTCDGTGVVGEKSYDPYEDMQDCRDCGGLGFDRDELLASLGFAVRAGQLELLRPQIKDVSERAEREARANAMFRRALRAIVEFPDSKVELKDTTKRGDTITVKVTVVDQVAEIKKIANRALNELG